LPPAAPPAAAPAAPSPLLAAREHLRAGRFAEATAAARSFIADHPESPQVFEARLLLVMSALRAQRPRDMRLAFGDLKRHHGADPRTPVQLLNIAESVLGSKRPGHMAGARELLQQIALQYPGTPAAARAKELAAKLPAAGRSPR
jgi:TolA-binding protein